MKTSMIIFGAMASVAMAQELSGFSDLPTCGQTCVTNMLNKADELSCTANDVACLCLNPDFSYGIRDCSTAACSGGSDASDTQSWAVDLCANQGVAITSVSETVAVSTVSGSTVATGQTTPLSVSSTLTSTLTSDGTTLTTTKSTLVPIVSTTSSTSTRSTATTTTTSTSTQTTDSAETDSSDSTDAAPRATAAVGVMAVAGLAAMLL